jgi:hypothetical protein
MNTECKIAKDTKNMYSGEKEAPQSSYFISLLSEFQQFTDSSFATKGSIRIQYVSFVSFHM